MQQLNFSFNWNNKLDCQNFTSLRLSNRFMVGDTVEIWLKGKFVCKATVIEKKDIKLNDIDERMARLDTGYDAEGCKKLLKNMYKKSSIYWDKQPIHLYLFEKQNHEKKQQYNLFSNH